MIKLVIDVRMIKMSGIGTYLEGLVPRLVRTGKFEICCLAYSNIEDYDWVKQVEVILVNSNILSLYEQLELPIKIPVCDLFWSPNWNIPLFPTKAKKRIATIHDVYHLANKQHFSIIKIGLMKVFMLRLLMYPKILTVSDFSKTEILKYTFIKASRTQVIPIAPKVFKTSNTLNIHRKKYILFVGNVKPHKNLKFALEAFELMANKLVDFFIVGKREGFITNETGLKNLIIRLGNRVTFTGVVNDEKLSDYYKNATLFLFPSLYEGFGLPVLEAMQFKIPILASNAASIREVGGNSVHYFNPTNKENLIWCLDQFFDGKMVDLTDTYNQHLESFSWEKTTGLHVKAFLELL